MYSLRSISYTPEEHLKFTVNSKVTVTVVSGDITRMQADAVVVGDDKLLTGVGAVARAVSAAGGQRYTKARHDMMLKLAVVGILGTAAMKPVYWCDAGPYLRYKRVYHAVVPQVTGVYNKASWQRATAALYTDVCSEADTANHETSIVAPILGTGPGGGDFADTVWAALNGIRAFQASHLRDVILVDRDREKAKNIVSVCTAWIARLQQMCNNTSCNILPVVSASGSPSVASASRLTPQHQTASSYHSGGRLGSLYQNPSISPSGGRLGSPHDPGLSGSQRNTTWPSLSSTRPRSSTAGGRGSWLSGDGSATGRPSSPANLGSSSAVNRQSWRDPPRQATGGDDDFDKGSSHLEKAAGAGCGDSSTSRSQTRRNPPQQSKILEKEFGKYNDHMEDIGQAARERRRAGKERSGQGHKVEMAARFTENSYEGRESQGPTFSYYGEGRPGLSGDWSATGRPSSPSFYGSLSSVNSHSWRDPLGQATGGDLEKVAGSSSTVNTHSWREPRGQATGGDDDFGGGKFHPEKASGAGYGSLSTSSSRAGRYPIQQSASLEENFEDDNYHMEDVVPTARVRRGAGKERSGQGHDDVKVAVSTEDGYGDCEFRGSSSGHLGDDSEHQHSHRRDDSDTSPREVDEDTGCTPRSTLKHGEPELQEKTERNPNAPNIVVLDSSSGESSDDENSPHPGTELL